MRPLLSAESWLVRTRHSPNHTTVYFELIGGNACTHRSLKNGRPLASSPASDSTLNLLLLRNRDFDPLAGRVLSAKALRSGKHNARRVTRPRTKSLLSMQSWERRTRHSSGSTLLTRS